MLNTQLPRWSAARSQAAELNCSSHPQGKVRAFARQLFFNLSQ
jgi:hypothetical protein